MNLKKGRYMTMKETNAMTMFETAKANYREVFNADGSIKVCGREACKTLIRSCMAYNPNVDFGNPETGMMNVNNIRQMLAHTHV